jgi:DNA segregation ATPase FtsK/SpoIIIE-like protein
MLNEEKIQTKLMEHGMLIKYEDKIEGYSVDLYRYNPSIGLKMSKIKGYVADIEQVVGTSGVRVLAPIPDTSLVGFEIPRKDRRFPEEIPDPDGFNIAIGADVTGNTYRFDIRKAPHLLIAGATGSGKSVFLNSIIKQLSQIKDVDLHLFDPKMVELSQFRGVAKEYFSDPESIYLALDELKTEMNNRYERISHEGARNIDEFREQHENDPSRKDLIRCSVIVERDTQKQILIGNRGSALKKLGQTARSDIEELLGRPVFLEIFIKVRPDWRKKQHLLKSYGY